MTTKPSEGNIPVEDVLDPHRADNRKEAQERARQENHRENQQWLNLIHTLR